MTNEIQPARRSTKETDPEGYVSAMTSLARCERSLRSVKTASARYASPDTSGSIERRETVYGPLTAEQSEYDDDMRAEIVRQDANPGNYDLPVLTPEQISQMFGVPVEMCRGLGTES